MAVDGYRAPEPPPKKRPPIGSRWMVVGFSWEQGRDVDLYEFVVVGFGPLPWQLEQGVHDSDGWRQCQRPDGKLEPRWAGGSYDWYVGNNNLRLLEDR